MALSENNRKERKTCILGINKANLETTIADISSFYKTKNLMLVKRFVSKQFGTANFLLEFKTPAACEEAKRMYSVLKVGGEELLPFFAPSDALQMVKSVVSDDKLYCRYPSTVSFEAVKAKLKGLEVTESGNDGHFCFISCKNAEEQMKIKKEFDGAEVEGKPLSITYAINKVKKTRRKKD